MATFPQRLARTLGRTALLSLPFLAAFCVTCLLLARVAPPPEISPFSDKLIAFQRQYAESEMIFLGSSRLYHAVEPARLDKALAKAGQAVKSFNFSQDALWPPESLFVLRQILAQPAPKLKWVVIELTPVIGFMREEVVGMARTRYWHDRVHTTIAEREMLAGKAPWDEKAATVLRHEWLWLQTFVNYAGAEPAIRTRLWPQREGSKLHESTRRAGFDPPKAKSLNAAEQAEFRQRLEENRAALIAQQEPLPPLLEEVYTPLIAEMRARGLEPVFIIPPTLIPQFNYATAPAGARLISFARPDRFPELYNPAVYNDKTHLNPQGAVLFTELLARELSGVVAATR